MGFLRPSTLTFANAKTRVCENVNAEGFTDQLTLAGHSIQAAIRHWNNAANWKWLGTTSSTYTMTVGDDTYSLPVLCKNVHSIRVAGSIPRALEYIGRRPLNKIIPKQDQQLLPYFYDLFTNESNDGNLRLFPIPSVAEEFVVDYYSQMVVPCSVTVTGAVTGPVLDGYVAPVLFTTTGPTAGITVGSPAIATSAAGDKWYGTIHKVVSNTSFYMDVDPTNPNGIYVDNSIAAGIVTVGGENEMLNVPADYEDGILAWASHHYLAKRQGGGPKLQYWAGYAQEQLDRALRNNQIDTPDAEIMFLPSYLSDSAFLGPNDIRWADIPW